MPHLCADSSAESTVCARGEQATQSSPKRENAMIVDHRTYELQPGRLREFLALYEKEGLPVQMKHLGNLVGYFTTEVGNVNEIVHIWGYDDLADRTKRRAAMAADPAWQAYLQKSREFMKHMNNKILVPTAFSPTK
jgi:hypothetical protein